jgi:hypothetical protein
MGNGSVATTLSILWSIVSTDTMSSGGARGQRRQHSGGGHWVPSGGAGSIGRLGDIGGLGVRWHRAALRCWTDRRWLTGGGAQGRRRGVGKFCSLLVSKSKSSG